MKATQCLTRAVYSGASVREAPLVRKIDNPSSRENLVVTSPYERPSSVQTLGEVEGRLNVTSIDTFHIPLEVTLTSKLG